MPVLDQYKDEVGCRVQVVFVRTCMHYLIFYYSMSVKNFSHELPSGIHKVFVSGVKGIYVN